MSSLKYIELQDILLYLQLYHKTMCIYDDCGFRVQKIILTTFTQLEFTLNSVTGWVDLPSFLSN